MYLTIPVAHVPGLGDPAYRSIDAPSKLLEDRETLVAPHQMFSKADSFHWLASLPTADDHFEYVHQWRRWAMQCRAGEVAWHTMPTRKGVASFLAGVPVEPEV